MAAILFCFSLFLVGTLGGLLDSRTCDKVPNHVTGEGFYPVFSRKLGLLHTAQYFHAAAGCAAAEAAGMGPLYSCLLYTSDAADE